MECVAKLGYRTYSHINKPPNYMCLDPEPLIRRYHRKLLLLLNLIGSGFAEVVQFDLMKGKKEIQFR
jgi:hypothetical protein